MTVAREIRDGGLGKSTRAMHLRGHASDLASNAEVYANDLERAVDGLTDALFGPRPRDADVPNLKPIPPQSLLDELGRLDAAIGRIGVAAKNLAELRERVQPTTAGPTSGEPEYDLGERGRAIPEPPRPYR